MKFIIYLIVLFIGVFNSQISFGVESSLSGSLDTPVVSETLQTEEYEQIIASSLIEIPEIIELGQTIDLSVGDLESRLLAESDVYEDYEFRWEIFNRGPIEGDDPSISFDTFGEKRISLSIFDNSEGNEETLLHTQDYNIFVYSFTVPLLVSETINDEEIENFIESVSRLGAYVYILGNLPENELGSSDINTMLTNFKKETKVIGDYVIIWGEKEFLLSSLTILGDTFASFDIRNYMLVSSYNTSILQSYLSNALAGKNTIDIAFISDEQSLQRVGENPLSITTLRNDLVQNGYSFQDVSNEYSIHPFLFISNFINSLSRSSIPTSDIYIILLLPVLLTLVAIAKHFIGLSTLGSIIPVFMSILFIKVGLVFTLGVLCLLLVANIIIASFINKYTLLYTPKVACITITNLMIFMICYQFGIQYEVIDGIGENILYIVLFFIIAEKLITVITSKEFREYKKSLTGTFIVSLFGALLYYMSGIMVFLTAYPEILLLLIPFNFFLGRFTGLRVTEYIRFKEISKNLEE